MSSNWSPAFLLKIKGWRFCQPLLFELLLYIGYFPNDYIIPIVTVFKCFCAIFRCSCYFVPFDFISVFNYFFYFAIGSTCPYYCVSFDVKSE